MNFYKRLELVLLAQSSTQKCEMFAEFYEAYQAGQLAFESEQSKALLFELPSYSSFVRSFALKMFLREKTSRV